MSLDKDDLYRKILSIGAHIIWVGSAYEHLYCVLSDGRTFRLDKFITGDGALGKVERRWTEVAQIPL